VPHVTIEKGSDGKVQFNLRPPRQEGLEYLLRQAGVERRLLRLIPPKLFPLLVP